MTATHAHTPSQFTYFSQLPAVGDMSEFLWKKQDLECSSQVEKKRRVLVLYTGGTIGMKWRNENGKTLLEDYIYCLKCVFHLGYSPVNDYFGTKIQAYPMLKDSDYKISDADTKVFGDIKAIALP